MKVIGVILLLVAMKSCAGPNRASVEQWRQHLDNADRLILAGDHDGAVLEVKSALAIAKEAEWNDGIVSAQVSLGELYAGRQNNLADESYSDAKERCRTDSRCTGLGNIYDHLFFLYAYFEKNPEKAVSLAREVKRNAERLARDETTMLKRMQGYSSLLKSAGLPAASNEIEKIASD